MMKNLTNFKWSPSIRTNSINITCIITILKQALTITDIYTINIITNYSSYTLQCIPGHGFGRTLGQRMYLLAPGSLIVTDCPKLLTTQHTLRYSDSPPNPVLVQSVDIQ